MSTACRLARAPAAVISPASFSPAAASRSRIPTAHPPSASRRAIAAPIPLAPPVTRTVRSFSPRISAPRLSCLHCALIGGAARQHSGCFVTPHNLVPLVLHLDPGNDDAAIPFRGGPHGSHLDLAMDGVTDAHRRQNLLLELEHGEARSLDHALAQQPLDQAVGQRGGHKLSLDRPLIATEGAVDENAFQHSGDAGEQDQVCLGESSIERAKALTGGELLPCEPEPERLHVRSLLRTGFAAPFNDA